KNEKCKALKAESPKISDFICTPCRDHYSAVKRHLSSNGILYTEDSCLVRGLDYYTRTTFEFVTDALGGQNAFAAGGRYNKLVEIFGGKPTPAVGFAAGIERMMIITEDIPVEQQRISAFLIHAGDNARMRAAAVLSDIRQRGISSDMDPSPVGMKSQMKKAERENAQYAVIIGDEEIAGEYYTVKNMDTGFQEKVGFSDLPAFLKGQTPEPAVK
ncbi:MAG: histidine--tRNA ligase, partial [Spirochaetota bacterium]